MAIRFSKAVGAASTFVVVLATSAFVVAAPGAVRPAATVATLASDTFGESASVANAWQAVGNACLTAGTAATPATSLPACKTAAPVDANGTGALQLTPGTGAASGMVVLRTPVATANGLQVTFDDVSFGGTTPGADGLVLFFTDAAHALPTITGDPGGSLGYANGTYGATGNATRPGIANAYLGIGFDEFGNYSSPTQRRLGGPGRTAETIAARGAATAGYPYLGGVTNAAGAAVSLPFSLDQPTVKVRPAQPPTITASLTPAGRLTVGVDRHDGHGYVGYYAQSIVGAHGQPAVPANLYVGLVASTGGSYDRHQIKRFSVMTLVPATSPTPMPTVAPTTAPTPSPTTAPPANAALSESFAEAASPANAWLALGDACLTAGTAASAATSIPACKTAAPQDVAGAGALQLTTPTTKRLGMALYRKAFAVGDGLRVSFDDASFGGSKPGADGLVMFFTDGTKAAPTAIGDPGGSIGYANGTYLEVAGKPTPGIANAYLGVALDEYGNFSAPTQGRVGGPGLVPETVAVRGAATAGYPYVGGVSTAAGKATSLPFSLDVAGVARPAQPPTVVVSLAKTGALSVTIDRHDGHGAIAYYSQAIVGVHGQPAVPSSVFLGFTASTGGDFNRHQIRNLTVSPLGATVPTPAPTIAPTPAPTAPPGPSNPLQDPPQIRSQNGLLTFNVVASQAANGRPQLVYNGETVPPTLRLLPGDTLAVNLTNNLPKPAANAGYVNDTNLHYHGLHVSPNTPGDDSIDMLAMPGQTLHYKIVIPKTHPTGLYWYHSHAHGEAERQNLAGMSGALIIDGIAASAPQTANILERILVVRDTLPAGQPLPAANAAQVKAMAWAMNHGNASGGASMPGMAGMARMPMSMDRLVRGSTTAATRNPYVRVDPAFGLFVRPAASTHCTAAEAPSRNWTVNGQTNPSIAIASGVKQFWRLVNAGSDTYLDLQVDGTQMQIVALDGVPLASVGNAAMTVTHYLVPPASRIEFVVTGPAAGTVAHLRTNCFDAGATGLAMPAATLATLTTATAAAVGKTLGHDRQDTRAHALAVLARPGAHPVGTRIHTAAYIRSFVSNEGIARTQTLTYSSQDQINGESYDPAGPPTFYAQSGTMERWQIVNASSQVHTFHIHQIHFLVQSIVGGTAVEQSNVGQEIDNINVPAATANGPGSVTLVMDFTDPAIVGTFLLHCHILSHEDMGMMAKIRVGTAPPLTTNAPSQGLTFASPTAAKQTFAVSGGKQPYSITGCANVANASVAGATVTVTPAGAGSCVLTLADASGLTVGVAITVTAPAAVVAVSPGSLAFAAPNAAAQNATISGGTAPYTVTGCANVATASVTNGTLSVRPTGVGACSLTVRDAAGHTAAVAVSVNAVATGAAVDNTTFHQNNARQGWYRGETALTAKNVNDDSFGKVTYLTGAGYGKVYAQPLFASGESIGNVAHNLVVVATATDRVVAYDDKTLAIVWQRSFTNAAAGITQQNWTDTACKDINPDVGIVGTPVIDRAKDRLYTVVPTKENGAFHLRLHAISLQNGADVVNPVEVSASVMLAGNTGTATTSAKNNLNRAALLEANGNVYVALGSHCDFQTATTHGWVLAYDATSLAPAGTVLDISNAQSNYYLGAPWMSGYGPAADGAGNVYFVTGNGPWNGVSAFSMSALKLPGNLNIANGSYFTPVSWQTDSSSDRDLGSGGVMLLPDGLSTNHPHLMVLGGKSGRKYVLDRDALGGLRAGDAGALSFSDVGGGIWGGPAFFEDAAGKGYVVYGNGAPFGTYAVNAATGALVSANQAYVGCLECRNGGSQPIVSSNGTTAGTAVVWALKTPNSGGGNITLEAFDASTMKLIYTGVAGTWEPGAGVGGIAGALVSPLVANGKVYVPTDGGVAVFGLSAQEDAALKHATGFPRR